MKTQHQRIIDLCADRGWHCQAEFWVISKSPHKRRDELAKRGYTWDERPCTHGITNSKDFRLIERPKRTITKVEVIDGKAYKREVEVEY